MIPKLETLNLNQLQKRMMQLCVLQSRMDPFCGWFGMKVSFGSRIQKAGGGWGIYNACPNNKNKPITKIPLGGALPTEYRQ